MSHQNCSPWRGNQALEGNMESGWLAAFILKFSKGIEKWLKNGDIQVPMLVVTLGTNLRYLKKQCCENETITSKWFL